MFGPLALLLGYVLTQSLEPADIPSGADHRLSDNADFHVWESDRILNSAWKRNLIQERRSPRILRTPVPEGISTGINRQKCLEYCTRYVSSSNWHDMSPNVNLQNKAGDLSQPESPETNLMPDEPPQSASSDWDVSGPAETNHMEVMERFNDTENETSPDLDIIELPMDIGESDILIADVNKNVPFVSEGEICEENEFPHMVALGVRISDSSEDISWNHCGGSLISEDYVLTAAHCVTRYLVKVRLGALKLDDVKGSQDINIDTIHIHPDYNGDDLYNDIALLKLERKVEFHVEGIEAACLWYEETYELDYAKATGWGRTGYVDPFSNILQKVVLVTYSNDACRQLLGQDKYIPQGILPTQICAGNMDGQQDTCTGDSGGPLQFDNILIHHRDNKCGMAVVGITSFGKWCGEKNLPGVYTRVAPYVPWIESIVWLGAGDGNGTGYSMEVMKLLYKAESQVRDVEATTQASEGWNLTEKTQETVSSAPLYDMRRGNAAVPKF